MGANVLLIMPAAAPAHWGAQVVPTPWLVSRAARGRV